MKAAIIGAGLIGASIGMALRERELVTEVSLYDPAPEAASTALERGAADRLANGIADACRTADIIFVATPVSVIPDAVAAACESAPARAIVTDVGSTKYGVVLDVENRLREDMEFVGGHPMAGSEEAGAGAARADLFEGAHWILTPTERSSTRAYEAIHALIAGMGGKVVALDPETHDDLMAVVSHVPQLVAFALMSLAADRTYDRPGSLGLAGRGFRDVTRIAASSPTIWLDICSQNRVAILTELDDLVARLSMLRDQVAAGDREALGRTFGEARSARRALRDKPLTGELFEVRIPVPDRPGVLALVTTTLGDRGINIEDLSIDHGVDGSRGVLSVVVAGQGSAEEAIATLKLHGLNAEAIAQ